jgi:ABC-type transport system involved in multi-copper enzyme maturation permease subunit
VYLLRQVCLVARLDLASALRSRRALAMLLLYVLVALGATYFFCRLIEAVLSSVGPADRLAESLARDPRVRRLVERLTGDAGVAERLTATPPLALFYGWLSLTFLPLLVVVNSSDAVAGQVRTGEARFVLFRAGRLAFALGTFAGQALLMTLGLALGATVSLVVGSVMLTGASIPANASALFTIGAGAWCYSFAYLGLALGVSQLVHSAGAARGLGFAVYMALSIGSALLWWSWVTDFVPGPLLPVARWCFPQTHALGLWRLTLVERLPAMGALACLGALYYLPGWLHFRGRDL